MHHLPGGTHDSDFPCSVHFVYEFESFILCVLWWNKKTLFFFIKLLLSLECSRIVDIEIGNNEYNVQCD